MKRHEINEARERVTAMLRSGNPTQLSNADFMMWEVLVRLLTEPRETVLPLHQPSVECKQEASAPLREALRKLVEAKALSGVRNLVAGWNGEGRKDGPYKRHDYELGAALPKTCCGEVYELDDAMQAARALIAEKPSSERD